MRTNKMLILGIIIAVICFLSIVVWNFRAFIIFDFSRVMYSNKVMIEKYFNLSLSDTVEIKQYFVKSDSTNPKSYVMQAMISVNESEIDSVLSSYPIKLRQYVGLTQRTILKNVWNYEGDIDFNIWVPSTVWFPNFGGSVMTQKNIRIFTLKPDNGKVLIFLWRDQLGGNEINQ